MEAVSKLSFNPLAPTLGGCVKELGTPQAPAGGALLHRPCHSRGGGNTERSLEGHAPSWPRNLSKKVRKVKVAGGRSQSDRRALREEVLLC